MNVGAHLDAALEVAIALEEEGRLRDSLSIYRLCAELGDLVAVCRLADFLSEHEEFLNIEEAITLYKTACLAGYTPACYNLGVVLDQLGRSAEAQKFYARAPDLE